MEATKRATIIALFIAVFSPSAAFAQTWVTPSGAVVDDSGTLISTVLKVVVIKDPLAPYKANPKKYEISTNAKGCTVVYAHSTTSRAGGSIVYSKCK